MVDLTKKPMREESWFRWKGGKKLAEKLRLQYTTPERLAQLGIQNTMTSDKGCKLCKKARTLTRSAFRQMQRRTSWNPMNYSRAANLRAAVIRGRQKNPDRG